MSYTSITFICFLLVTGIAYFLVPKRIQWGVLLAGYPPSVVRRKQKCF